MPFPTVPVPRTWGLRQLIKAPALRADVADAIALLAQPPVYAGANSVTPTSVPGVYAASLIPQDAEMYDPWSMHQVQTAHPALAYPPLPGFYLAQAFAPLAATAGGGLTAACIRTVQGGGAAVDWQGQTLPNGPSFAAGPVAAKIVRISATGWGTGDYAGLSAYQTSSGAVSTIATTSKYPTFRLQWVGALAGTSGLPVPPLTAWPIPPAYITSAFMNANVRDAIRFLIYPPFGEWQYNSGTQTLYSATAVPLVGSTISLDSTVCDNYSAMDLATGTWTAPVGGLYWTYIAMTVSASPSTRAVAVGPTVKSANYNGGTVTTLWNGAQAALGSTYNTAVFRRKLRLAAGDTIRIGGWQVDASGTGCQVLGSGLTPDARTRMIIIWDGL